MDKYQQVLLTQKAFAMAELRRQLAELRSQQAGDGVSVISSEFGSSGSQAGSQVDSHGSSPRDRDGEATSDLDSNKSDCEEVSKDSGNFGIEKSLGF